MLYVIARKMKSGDVEITFPSTNMKAYFNKDDSNKPTYRNKYVTLNCFKYGIMWDKR